MKVCIKTAGYTGRRMYEILKEEKSITVVSFTDNDVEKWGQYIDDIPIESVLTVFEKYKAKEVDKILIGTEMPVKLCRAMYKELIEIGFGKNDVLFVPIEYLKQDEKSCCLIAYESFNYLQYLEFHLTNKCNLNCAGCSHFVPLVPQEDEIDFDELKRDMVQLKKRVNHISVIRIMGGEPLLSSHLAECCQIVRRLYPYSHVVVATNGALVKKNVNGELLQVFRQERIVLDVTCYPPLYERYPEIAEYLKLNSLPFHMDIRWGMCPVLHPDNKHKFRQESVELTCECVNLYKGNLYPCPMIAFISYFNKYFDQKYPEEVGADIYRETNFEEMYQELFAVRKLCDYCNNYDMFENYNRRKFCLVSEKPRMEQWIRDYEEK